MADAADFPQRPAIGGKGSFWACRSCSGETTTLYRAVDPAELADINATGVLRNRGSAEGKYFTTSAAYAAAYAKEAVKIFGDPPYTYITTKVPNSAFQGLSPATVDRGIQVWVIPTNRLHGLTAVVRPSMPIPPPKF